MKLSLPALRNTPWFKATSGQWRYALRNTIAIYHCYVSRADIRLLSQSG